MDSNTTMTIDQTKLATAKIDSQKPVAALGFNQLYRDFLTGKDSALAFYPNQNLSDLAPKFSSVSYDRDAIADILLAQNKRFGAKAQALANIEKLRDPNSLVVFAGQQAGLFGGPLLGLYKAIWAVKRAAELERELARPVIPIFWIAADDHDFEEINHCYIYDALGEPQALRYYESSDPGSPAYNQRFNSKEILDEICAGLRGSLGETDFTPELLKRLFEAYSEGEDFVGAFGKFFTDTIPDIGLTLFNPGDSAVKKLAAPLYKTILDKQAELKSALNNRNEEILAAGYHLQVEKEDSACHLFLLTPERSALHCDGQNYRAGEKQFSRAELDTLIDTEPERFSPDVITRPLLAAYLFPTVEQAGGPSEVAYFAQLSGLFEIVQLPAPIFSGRITVTLLEKRFEKLLSKHDLAFNDFTGDIETTINEVLGRTFPDDLKERFAEIRRDYHERFNNLSADVISFDKSLEGNAKQIWSKVESALEVFEKKTFASHKRKLADERAAMYRAANALYPMRALQERSISMLYYLSRYGYQLIDFLVDALEAQTEEHQIVYLSSFSATTRESKRTKEGERK